MLHAGCHTDGMFSKHNAGYAGHVVSLFRFAVLWILLQISSTVVHEVGLCEVQAAAITS